jgi:hypothetical protein
VGHAHEHLQDLQMMSTPLPAWLPRTFLMSAKTLSEDRPQEALAHDPLELEVH